MGEGGGGNSAGAHEREIKSGEVLIIGEQWQQYSSILTETQGAGKEIDIRGAYSEVDAS